MAVVLHLQWCQRKYDTVFVQCLVESVLVFPHVTFPISRLLLSVVCRIDSARFGCDKYCIRNRWRPLLLLSYVALGPRNASSPLLTSVSFTVTRALPLHSSAKARYS